MLSEVDFIAAEDTRNTARLLAYLGIRKPLVSYHDHNRSERGETLITRLEAGESCALVSDAGMPGISDPGEDMVKLCAEKNIPVTVIPGPCAAICALVLSAIPCGKFVFEGFLSAKKSERRTSLEAYKNEKKTVIFYEAPHKLRASLDDMLDIFGAARRISLCRELTKLNEEIMRTDLGHAVEYYRTVEPRGEYVLVLEGCAESSVTDFWKDMDEIAHVRHYMSAGMTKNEAIKAAAKDRGVHKNEVYRKLIDS